MPEDKRGKLTRFKRIIHFTWPFILIIAVFASTQSADLHKGFIERYYSHGLYPLISLVFSSVSRHVPFSLWDLFWALMVILLLSGIILIIIRKIKPGWLAVQLIRLVAVLYALFYISWGYNYFRPAIGDRLNWDTVSNDSVLFRTVLDSVISQANKNYIIISPSDYPVIDSLVENSYLKNSDALKITYPNGERRPKTMLFSSIFSKLGVSGYFGPFFNEIHLNHYLLPMDYPFVLAHEKAHQFGFTSEAEANFTAFIVCTSSDDQRLRYSGYQSVLLYFLRDASSQYDYRELLQKVSKQVIDDLRYRQHYYDSLQNEKMSELQTRANNAYLKVNKIHEGIRNYDQVVSLVINWYQNSK